MLNGSKLKQNHPYGVVNVVNNLDSSASGICQNPLLESNLLNIVASVNCAKVVLTFGIVWFSCRKFSLIGFMSIQIVTALEAFGTTTMAAHQEVDSLARLLILLILLGLGEEECLWMYLEQMAQY